MGVRRAWAHSGPPRLRRDLTGALPRLVSCFALAVRTHAFKRRQVAGLQFLHGRPSGLTIPRAELWKELTIGDRFSLGIALTRLLAIQLYDSGNIFRAHGITPARIGY